MQVLRMPVGQLSTNCYLLYTEPGGQGALIDPGAETLTILTAIEKRRLDLKTILLTHGHADHIGAAAKVREKTGAKIYIHSQDAEMAKDPELNLSPYIGFGSLVLEPDRLLAEGESVEVCGERLKVLYTPGHTPGSVCYYCQKLGVLFSGDTLFAGGFGRTDLVGGDEAQLKASLEKILPNLPEETLVYPGHGGKTTIGGEQGLLGLL
ncbi:MAG: MBL fold metallo-hydrolase [Firmicutes bacterium]|nr:MBL fold metallo-hydrolase [Bacillota bacterium]